MDKTSNILGRAIQIVGLNLKIEVGGSKTMETRQALDDLLSTNCQCGKSKASRKSHCRTCYFKLPPAMRSALYRKIREGYEEAYAESLAYLARLKVEA